MINCIEINEIHSEQAISTLSNDALNWQISVPYVPNLTTSWMNLTIQYNELKYTKYSIFDENFLEYIDMTNLPTNKNYISENLKNDILTHLDILFLEFPLADFEELSLIRFEWDNTTRLVLKYAPDNSKLELIKQLRDEFWSIYNKRKNATDSINSPLPLIQESEIKAKNELIKVEQKIVNIRDQILSKYYTPTERSKKLAKSFIQSRKYILNNK